MLVSAMTSLASVEAEKPLPSMRTLERESMGRDLGSLVESRAM